MVWCDVVTITIARRSRIERDLGYKEAKKGCHRSSKVTIVTTTVTDLSAVVLASNGFIIQCTIVSSLFFPPSHPMVRLTLSSTKGTFPPRPFQLPNHHSTGNQGLRHFPYTGYLGLTPIRVEGCALYFLVF